MAKRWYVVHAYSGFESHVKRSLEERIARAGMQDLFDEILVPTEELDTETWEAFLSERAGRHVEVRRPQRGDKLRSAGEFPGQRGQRGGRHAVSAEQDRAQRRHDRPVRHDRPGGQQHVQQVRCGRAGLAGRAGPTASHHR